MKTLFKILAPALAAAALAASAAVPVAWTNSPATPQPYPLKPVPHGVPVDFRVTLKGYTSPPIAPGADVRLWFQTNGMGSAWWSAPATFDGSVISATFGPAEDTGADRVSIFFGAPSNVFASAVLRLTHSPGFAPASLPIPVPVLDFSAVSVLHAPWPDASDVTNAAEAAVGRFEESLKYGMDVGTGAIYGFVGDDHAYGYGLAWDGSWRYIKAGEGWTTPGTELARMGDIPDLSHYATMEAATNAAAAVVARDAVAKSYGDGGGTFGWTGPHVIGGTGFDLFLPGGLTVGNNRISTAGGHALTLPERTGTVALSSDVSQVVALVGQTSSTLSSAITNDSISAYADSATNSLGGIVYRLGAVSVSAQVDEAMSDLLGSDWKATYGGGAAGIVAALLAAVAALWRTKLNVSNGVAENLKADGLKMKVVVDTGRMSVTYGQWSNVEVSPVSGSSTDWQPQDQSFTLKILSANICAILPDGSATPTVLAHAETSLPWTLTAVGYDTPVGSVAAVTETQWVDVATTAFVQGAVPYALGAVQTISAASQDTSGAETIDYGTATMLDRTGNYVAITTALDELRVTFPAATSGKVRDFGLRVEIGTGSAALAAPAIVPVAPAGETITLENSDGAIPELADGTATAKGVTLLYFSETAPGVFVVKGEQVEEVA